MWYFYFIFTIYISFLKKPTSVERIKIIKLQTEVCCERHRTKTLGQFDRSRSCVPPAWLAAPYLSQHESSAVRLAQLGASPEIKSQDAMLSATCRNEASVIVVGLFPHVWDCCDLYMFYSVKISQFVL